MIPYFDFFRPIKILVSSRAITPSALSASRAEQKMEKSPVHFAGKKNGK